MNITTVEIILDGLEAAVDGRGFNAEHLAATHLANAAPEMLAALEACELVIPRDRRVTLEAARAAIAKAKSEVTP